MTRYSLIAALALAVAAVTTGARVYAESQARAAGPVAPVKCQCEKGGKGCTCPPGQCECPNCGAKNHRH